ncbi:orotate phosphoribosyltransferase [Streptomyces sp. NPDC007025]|uniref:orotate phosphoribosyltransferase n=1 Tax=Streptomyces sp. NPDC007025 TaxID=3364771 RepID=UPI00367811C1
MSAPLAAAIAAAAYREEPYRLPDGRRLERYFDPYRLSAEPALLARTAAALAALLPPGTQALAGPALAAVPLVTALSLHTGLPAFYLRPVPKGHGSRRQIEGGPAAGPAGLRTVVLDDTARTGTSLLVPVRRLRLAGARVHDALAVVDRQCGAAALLGQHRVTLHCLITDAGTS